MIEKEIEKLLFELEPVIDKMYQKMINDSPLLKKLNNEEKDFLLNRELTEEENRILQYEIDNDIHLLPIEGESGFS